MRPISSIDVMNNPSHNLWYGSVPINDWNYDNMASADIASHPSSSLFGMGYSDNNVYRIPVSGGISYDTSSLYSSVYAPHTSSHSLLYGSPAPIRPTIMNINGSTLYSAEKNSWMSFLVTGVSPTEESALTNGIDSLMHELGFTVPQKPSPVISRLNSNVYDFSNGIGRYSKEVISIQSKIRQLYRKYKRFRDNAILLEIKKLKEFSKKEAVGFIKRVRRQIRKQITYCKILISVVVKIFRIVSSYRRIIRYQLKMISKGSIDEDASALVNSALTRSDFASTNHLIYLYHEPKRIFNRVYK